MILSSYTCFVVASPDFAFSLRHLVYYTVCGGQSLCVWRYSSILVCVCAVKLGEEEEWNTESVRDLLCTADSWCGIWFWMQMLKPVCDTCIINTIDFAYDVSTVSFQACNRSKGLIVISVRDYCKCEPPGLQQEYYSSCAVVLDTPNGQDSQSGCSVLYFFPLLISSSVSPDSVKRGKLVNNCPSVRSRLDIDLIYVRRVMFI